MNFLKKLTEFLGLLFFAFMLAVCMVMGVAPVIPKRKEQFSIEVKMEQIQNVDKKIISLEQSQDKN
jgi:preprotein translocase subunit SecG